MFKSLIRSSILVVEGLERRQLLSAAAAPVRPALILSGNVGHAAATASPVASAFTPAQINHAYGIDQIKFGSVTGNGAGETIAIIDPYNDPAIFLDLSTFDKQFNLPGTTPAQTATFLKVVNQTGGSALPARDNTNGHWPLEECLDVQWAHAIAPAAKLLLVECNSANYSDMLAVGANWARNQPGVVAISMSFAGGESPGDATFDPYLTTPAKHTGVTFVAATGDGGQPAGYPAVSPGVLAVGATSLRLSGSNYQSEQAYRLGGGGVSSYELQPGYQNSLVTQNHTFRTAPDVAFDGDPLTGVPVVDSLEYGLATPWMVEAGTSFATVAWASLIAITDQGRGLTKLAPLDGLTGTLPRLYNLPSSDFHDINSGDNGFAAGSGYDLTTGRGTPIANKLVNDLLHDAAGPIVTGDSVIGFQNDSITAIDINFNQAMNTKSFSLKTGITKFTGANGANFLGQISSFTWLNKNITLQLNLKAITSDNTYSLTLSPRIQSSAGKSLDQNFNGKTGESADSYTLGFKLAASIGPDAYGYSAKAGKYQYTTLNPGAAGVTAILPGTDDGSTQVSLGTNTFNFYGTNYSSVFVDSNGFISFTAGGAPGGEYANTDLTSDPAVPTIAALWDDWTTGNAASETVLYKFVNPTSGGAFSDLIIEWHGVQNQGAAAAKSTATATFAVDLQLNTTAPGLITFNYANLNLNVPAFNNGASATVGISDGGNTGQLLLVSLDDATSALVGSQKTIVISNSHANHHAVIRSR